MLGLATVAEYVADQATLDALREIDVDFLQGNSLGAAVPLHELFEPEQMPADSV